MSDHCKKNFRLEMQAELISSGWPPAKALTNKL